MVLEICVLLYESCFEYFRWKDRLNGADSKVIVLGDLVWFENICDRLVNSRRIFEEGFDVQEPIWLGIPYP